MVAFDRQRQDRLLGHDGNERHSLVGFFEQIEVGSVHAKGFQAGSTTVYHAAASTENSEAIGIRTAYNKRRRWRIYCIIQPSGLKAMKFRANVFRTLLVSI